MDQPTALDVLQKLEPLVGQWSLTAIGPDGEAWPGEGRTTFYWRDGAPFPQRFTGSFEDSERRIVGRWEKAEDGTNLALDLELVFRRVE